MSSTTYFIFQSRLPRIQHCNAASLPGDLDSTMDVLIQNFEQRESSSAKPIRTIRGEASDRVRE